MDINEVLTNVGQSVFFNKVISFFNNIITYFINADIFGKFILTFIFVLFLYAMYTIIVSSVSAKSKINQLKKAFSKYENIDIDAINKLNSEFKTDESKEIWKKFKDSLVKLQNKVGEDVFYTTYPIKDFFDLNLVGGKLVSNKLIPIIPSILTGLGLLGTFYGLTTGLSGIDIHNVENLTNSIGKIISGASIAFVTSLIGIGLSLIVNLCDKITIKGIKCKLNELKKVLYPLFPQLKLEETFIQISEYNKNMNEAMGELAEKIGNKMQEGMLEATSKMNNDISSALEKLALSTQSFGERIASGSESVLSSLVSEFTDKIGENASSHKIMLEEAANKMSTVVSSLDEMMRNYNETTIESFENIKKQQEEANKQNIENINSYNNKLIEVTDSVFKNQEKQSQIIDNLLDKCSSVSTELSAELVDLKSNLTNVNFKLTNIISKFHDTVEKLDEATSRLEKAGDIFQDAGEKIATPITKTISAFENLTEKTLNTQTTIENISQNLADITSESEEILNSVNTLFNKSNNSFNEMSKQQTAFLNQLKENIISLHQEVVGIFENYKESITNQTNERLEQWNEKTSQFSNSMLNTVKAIQSIVDDIEKKVS